MASHGGIIGVIAALLIFAHRHRLPGLHLVDVAAFVVPPGLFLGRLANFINGELWGKPTDFYLGMLVPGLGDIPRHPSQLYEAALEGLALFVLLWVYSSKPRPMMAVSGLFLLGYGAFRFFVEFVRLPDAHLGYLAFGWLTMGQILTLPMLLLGMFFIFRAYQKGQNI
jgi:phosphatidylglycerol:prolipoprotein diacylglycerol transferase